MPPKSLLSTPAPPQPAYILRGHTSPVHALIFLLHNTHILTGDADGNCILWSLSTRRPLAVWAAHTASILSLAEWAPTSATSPDCRIITHGRDHKLRAWRFPRAQDDVGAVLPVDGTVKGKSPWLVASLSVNTLNFCGFGFCAGESGEGEGEFGDALVAVPSVLESSAVDVFSLPSTQRVHTRIQSTETTGMAMTLALRRIDRKLKLLAGYESGHVVVFALQEGVWETVYAAKPHSQPALGLAVHPCNAWFLTTSADALVVRHALEDESAGKTLDTRHAGLQGVAVRSDGKVFATAGWDGRFRVFSAAKMKELAVLKWHPVGCYAIAFAEILEEEAPAGEELVKAGAMQEVSLTVEEARVRRESRKHWIAGGAKDGKVSLWEIY